MTILVAAGWDFARIGSFSMQFIDTGGTVTISLPTGTYSHVDITGVVSDYLVFGAALETALNASALNGTFAVDYQPASNTYIVQSNIDFDYASANAVAQRILGLPGAAGGAQSLLLVYRVTSTNQAYYGILGAQGAASNKTDDYEPNAITEGAVADDGSPYAVSVTTAPVYCDFVLPFEPKAKTHAREAAATVPWTFQHFFQHVRGSEPFAVVDDVETTVHKLRADATNFRPERVTIDYDDHWNVPFQTHVLGRP